MSSNPIVTEAVALAEKKQRPRPYFFYGDQLRNLECRPVEQFPGITTLLELFAVLEQCWSRETAYPACREGWNLRDPSFGQCAITATLVCDMFGGTIHKIRTGGGGTHYFNCIDGAYVDLTREQFDLCDIPAEYEPNQEIPRQYCGKNADTLARYRQLQRNMIRYLRGENLNRV